MGDVVVAGRPQQVMEHLAVGCLRECDNAYGVSRIAASKNYVRRFHGHVSSGADGDTHVGRGKRGSVVDAVAGHGDALALGLKPPDRVGLAVRQHLGEYAVDADLSRDVLGDFLLVAGEHDGLHAQLAEAGNGFFRFRANDVGKGKRSGHEVVLHNPHDRFAFAAEGVHLVAQKRGHADPGGV